MLSFDFTFLFTAVNLLILYLFLRKFLFGKVGNFLENRAKSIEDDIEESKRLKAEGDGYKNEYMDILNKLKDDEKRLTDEMVKKATLEYDSIVSDAKKEAQEIIAHAKLEANYETARQMESFKMVAADLVIETAEKLLSANLDDEKNRKLVDQLLKEGAA